MTSVGCFVSAGLQPNSFPHLKIPQEFKQTTMDTQVNNFSSIFFIVLNLFLYKYRPVPKTRDRPATIKKMKKRKLPLQGLQLFLENINHNRLEISLFEAENIFIALNECVNFRCRLIRQAAKKVNHVSGHR